MKSMDLIVETPFQPGKPHTDLIALGYEFLCSHISIERFYTDDFETTAKASDRIVAVQQENDGFNFYRKPL